MPAKTRSGTASFALKKLTSALACALLLSVPVHAAGLGKLKVLSALGQPLKAEIELTALSNDEAGSLAVKLAPVDAFRLANIEFNPALMALRFSVEQRSGRQYIAIASSQPVNEPFIDLLLELSWNNGRLVREYTFLLDPPELRQNPPAQSAEALDLPGVPTQPSAPLAAPRARPVPAATRADSAPVAPIAPRARPYKVRSGDTLSQIALRIKPADVSLDQMLAALYRSNPDAFTGKNINRLQAGKILAMPDDASMRAESRGEASRMVTAHAIDFSAYRNKLAGQVALSAPAKGADASQSAAGKISAKVEERATPANASKDQLKLSKAEPGAQAAGERAAPEDLVAQEQQFADAQARVKELEKNVSDLENLVAAKALQESAPGPAAAPIAAPAVVAVPKPAPAPVPVPAKPAAPSLLDTVLGNIIYVAMGLAALLLALLALIAVRRKRARAAAPTPGTPAAEAADPDASNNSVFNSTFAASSSQIDTDEVDPVAEADVYIAYGREAQAEEILKEALRTHPERHPVRLKLLEIYAAHQDTESFEAQASQLHRLSQGSGDEWEQAAAMGLAIDPLNPLYASAAEVILAAPALDQNKTESLAAATGIAALASARDQSRDQTPAELDLSDADDRAGLSFEQDIAPAARPVDTPAPPRVEPSDIDFDFLVEPQPEPQPEITPAPLPAPPAPAPAAQTDASLDFDFDLLPELAPEPAPEPEPAPISKSEPKPEPKPAAALEPLLDLDLGESEPPAAAPDFDLSGITLDLNKAAPEVAPEPAVAEEVLSALAVEMDTKLDLAVAYQEIGDKEGARELLDEVIKGGSKEQIAKAVAMLAQLV